MNPTMAFVGTGRMGGNMARRLKDCGYNVTAVYGAHAPIAADSARAREVARERLVTVRRREAFSALIRTLSESHPVSVEREHLEAILPALGEPSGPAT